MSVKNKRKYFRTLLFNPSLKKEEEDALFQDRYAAENYEKIIHSHAKMVVKFASKYKFYTTISEEDLVQEGMLGLIRAIEKFDPDNGGRFSTYARWWIRAMIQAFLVAHLHTVKNQYKRILLIQQQADYCQDRSRLNTDPEDIHTLDHYAYSFNISFDDVVVQEKLIDHYGSFEDESLNHITFENRSRWLRVALAELTPLEAFVITSLFLTDTKPSIIDVASKLEVSVARTRAIMTKAMRKLRSILAKKTDQLHQLF